MFNGRSVSVEAARPVADAVVEPLGRACGAVVAVCGICHSC